MPNRLNCISATGTRLITKQGDLIHYYKGVLTSLIGSNLGGGGGEEAISIVNQNLPETMTLTIQPYMYIHGANVHIYSNE